MRCTHNLNGKQCRAWAQKNKVLCFRHDPDNKELCESSSKKGGQNRTLQGRYGTEIQLTSPEDIKNFLSLVINAVWSGGVPIPVGSSMGFLTRCWLDAYELSDIAKRLEDLERKVDQK